MSMALDYRKMLFQVFEKSPAWVNDADCRVPLSAALPSNHGPHSGSQNSHSSPVLLNDSVSHTRACIFFTTSLLFQMSAMSCKIIIVIYKLVQIPCCSQTQGWVVIELVLKVCVFGMVWVCTREREREREEKEREREIQYLWNVFRPLKFFHILLLYSLILKWIQ